jgi:Thiol:disulfide interchange protein
MKSALMFILLLPALAFARLTDGKVHFKLQDNKIVGTVDKGFHFNAKAPASIEFGTTKAEPQVKTEKEMSFDAAKVKKEVLMLSFYVCDDANTVCEMHEDQYEVAAGKLVAANTQFNKEEKTATAPVVKESAKKISAKPVKVKVDHHGFIRDDFAAALAKATAEKKLVLVDFGAPWCPSCVRMETEAFPNKEFQKATRGVVKLAINVDKPENTALKKQYGVKAIPTLILMNAQGAELHRVLDFIPPKELAAQLTTVLKSNPKSNDELLVAAKAGDKDAQKTLGARYSRQLNFEEASKWYNMAGDDSLSAAMADVETWHEKYSDKKDGTKEYQAILKKWLAKYPESLESLDWREYYQATLSDKESKEKNSLSEENVKLIEAWLASPEKMQAAFAATSMGDFTGKMQLHLYTSLASNYETLKQTEKQNAAKAAALAEISKVNLSVERPGEVLSFLYYMRVNGDKANYVSWVEKLVAANPGDDTYEARLARYWLGEKEFAKALPLAQQAVSRKGERELSNLKLLAEIQKGLNKPEDMKATVGKALALPAAQLEQYKTTVTALKEL